MERKLAVGLLMVLFGMGAVGVCKAGPPVILHGTYKVALDTPMGQATCVESWTFAANGIETIESGDEVAHERYRIEVVDGDDWLIAGMIDTNGRPDCSGKVTKTLDPEKRLYFYQNSVGGFVLCAPPQEYAGQRFVTGCYGHSKPLR